MQNCTFGFHLNIFHFTLLSTCKILLTVFTVNIVRMVTHKASLLELCALWAGEQHPPGLGGAHAQQVGGAGGGHVSIVALCHSRAGELIRRCNLKMICKSDIMYVIYKNVNNLLIIDISKLVDVKYIIKTFKLAL